MFVIPMLIMFVIPMPIQVSSFPILTPPPAKSQTPHRICYGFLTNSPARGKLNYQYQNGLNCLYLNFPKE